MFGTGSSKKDKLDPVAKLAELREALSADVNAMLTDDDCLRFLVARQYDISKALDMLNKFAVWYKTPLTDQNVDEKYKNLRPCDLGTNVTDDKEHLATDTFLWSNTGEDKDGRPIYWEKIGYCEYLLIY